VKTRTALLLVVVGIGTFVIAEIRKRHPPVQEIDAAALYNKGMVSPTYTLPRGLTMTQPV
jgi:hypothetical protein